VRTERAYRPETLVLETRFYTETGIVLVTDFMPLRGENSDVVRIAHCVQGSVAMRMDLTVRFDYGRTVPWMSRMPDGSLRAIAGPHMVQLHAETETHGRDKSTISEFTLNEGENRSFVMTYSLSYRAAPAPVEPWEALASTLTFWQNWSTGCSVKGEWRDVVTRSLITLKALTYRPTGGIVAALTTSLPERLGGERNWDYRYCWLRDATFTLLALMNSGYYEEAEAWREWLVRAGAGSPEQVQIMYGVTGERDLPERVLPRLAGYENSLPVRIGNAAAGQLQLDIYGEVADALHQARSGRLNPSQDAWNLQIALTRHLETIWNLEDEGIWEFRGPSRHFTHSKVMAWVAFDRAIKAIEVFGFEGPAERWRAVRDQIHDQVCERGWNENVKSFVQSYGSHELDASLLLMPLVGFLPATDPRVLSTVAAIETTLCVDGFLLRYNTGSADDALSPGEGVFLACNFWLADNFVLQRRYDKARQLFEKLIRLRNDVGLMAEEYDPKTQGMLGNFPQAFSHVALINTALNLSRIEGPAEQRREGSRDQGAI
jgi:GH15 family glucan-1,4-alpha-glucosidase